MSNPSFRVNAPIPIEEILDLYRASTLSERRPVADRDRFRAMIENANLTVSAWQDGLLVGISRSLSDFSFCTYCSDLAVRKSHQRKGLGKALLRETQKAGGRARLILLAAPAARDYYRHIGMEKSDLCWTLDPGRELH